MEFHERLVSIIRRSNRPRSRKKRKSRGKVYRGCLNRWRGVLSGRIITLREQRKSTLKNGSRGGSSSSRDE